MGILGAAYFWASRARDARDAVEDIANVADDVRLAFRRMGFRRQSNVHPVDAIDDPAQLIGIIVRSFIEIRGEVTSNDLRLMRVAFRDEFGRNDQSSEDLAVISDWAMRECGTADAAISRAAKRLYKSNGNEGFQALMRVIGQITSDTRLHPKQKESLDDIG